MHRLTNVERMHEIQINEINARHAVAASNDETPARRFRTSWRPFEPLQQSGRRLAKAELQRYRIIGCRLMGRARCERWTTSRMCEIVIVLRMAAVSGPVRSLEWIKWHRGPRFGTPSSFPEVRAA